MSVTESDYCHTVTTQSLSPQRIVSLYVFPVMDATVNLNSQLESVAVEIRNVPVNHTLRLKLMPPFTLPLA